MQYLLKSIYYVGSFFASETIQSFLSIVMYKRSDTVDVANLLSSFCYDANV